MEFIISQVMVVLKGTMLFGAYVESEEENEILEANYTLTYSKNSDGKSASITGYKGTPIGNLIIPDTIDGYTVTTIKNSAFFGCSTFTGTLTIPNSVTTIEAHAFDGCSGLTGTLTIPDSVSEIGDFAFADCTGILRVINNSDVWILLPKVEGKVWKNFVTDEQLTWLGTGTAVRLDYENPTLTSTGQSGRWKVSNEGSSPEYSFDIDLDWEIDRNGILTVDGTSRFPTKRNSYFTYWGDYPWSEYRDDITGAKFSVSGSMNLRFLGYKNMQYVDFSKSNCEILDLSYAFKQCENLKWVDFSGLDTSGADNFCELFFGCKALTNPDVEHLDMSSGEAFHYVFYDCDRLEVLDFSNKDLSSGTSFSQMIYECDNLEYVSFRNAIFGSDCEAGYTWGVDLLGTHPNLKILDLGFDARNLKGNFSSFDHCEKLEKIWLPYNFNIQKYGGYLPGSDAQFNDKIWYLSDGSTITKIPKSLSYSRIAQCNSIPSEDDDRYGSPTITLNAGEGFCSVTELKANKSGHIIELPEAVRSGYIFWGWYSPTGARITPDYFFLEDMTIYAKYIQLEWTIEKGVLTIEGDVSIPDVYSINDTPWGKTGDSIDSIVVKEGITSLGDNIFAFNKNAASIRIPSTVNSIYGNPFDKNSPIVIYYDGTKDEWKNITKRKAFTEFLLDQKVTVHFSDNSLEGYFNYVTFEDGDNTASYDYYCNFDWFFNSSSNYNHELAQTSLKTAMSGFGLSSKGKEANNIKKLFDDLELQYSDSSIVYPQSIYESDFDNIGSAIGSRTIEKGGKKKTLILVVVRGKGYKAEWGGNFNLGNTLYGTEHKGFNIAADKVKNRLVSYINENKDSFEDEVVVWTVGFSRAAATANLLAAKIDRGEICSDVIDDTYAYCFACPQNTTSLFAHESKYKNIFSIVSEEDLVPKVAPNGSGWGFDRYGTVYTLPSYRNSSNKTIFYARNDIYRDIFKRQGVNVDQAYSKKIQNYCGQAEMFDYLIETISTLTKGRDYFNTYYQDLAQVEIVKIMSSSSIASSDAGDWLWTYAGLIIDNTFAQPQAQAYKTRWKLNAFGYLVLDKANKAALGNGMLSLEGFINNAHTPELYLAWMESLQGDAVTKNKGYRKVYVNCPVDVIITNSSGETVGQIIDDEARLVEDGVITYVDENGQKVAVVPLDSEYNIELVATDNGNVSCSIAEYENDETVPDRIINYRNMEVAKNEQLETLLGEGENQVADYSLSREDGLFETPDEILSGGEIEQYQVIAKSNSNLGEVSGGGYFCSGEFAKLTATPSRSDIEFMGWYADEELVSEELEYRFPVSDGIELEARFADIKMFRYTELSNGTIRIDGVTQTTSDNLVIPSKIKGKKVAAIKSEAFRSCSGLTGNLVIPYGVTTIGDYAFYNCSGLTGDLIIPDSVTSIDNGAFWGCSGFTGGLTIPDSVTTIGYSAFRSCSGLTGDLIIPDSVTSIGESAFEKCSGLTGNLVIPNGVTTIGDYAFYNCSGLTGDLIIPDSVTSIDNGAFWGCSGFTGGLTIPDSVTTIGYSAFRSCSGLTGDLIIPDSVTSIGESAFEKCSGLTGNLVIPNGVTTIGDYAFYNCSGLTGDLIIPDSVTTIGYSAFRSCSGLTGDLIIPDSVTSIGKYAFYNCSGLTGDLTIPDSVTSIGEYAFCNCSGLTGDLTIPNSVTSIEKSVFYNCSGLTGNLVIPNGVTTIGDYAFDKCSGLTGDLTIPDSVTSIGKDAFEKCSGFTGKLTISNSITIISDGTFNGCSGFTGNLSIPNGVTTIGYSAFQKCSGLTGDLIIPNSVTSIGTAAFELCSGFSGLYLPNGVTSIGFGAFRDCKNLAGGVVIPNSVKSIDIYVFDGCNQLKYIDNRSSSQLQLPDFYNKTWRNEATGKTITSITKGVAARSDYVEAPRDPETPENVNGFWVKIVDESMTEDGKFYYTGKKIVPNIIVYDGSKELVAKKDYTYSIINNINAGIAAIVVKGKGAYSGTEIIEFEILRRDISTDEFVADEIVLKSTGKEQKPKPVITWNGKTVPKSGYDYMYYGVNSSGQPTAWSYPSVNHEGNYIIVIKGKGNFTGTRTEKLTLSNSLKDVSKLSVAKIPSQPYSGGSIIPSITVKDGKLPLTAGGDYLVSFVNNIEVGTATAIITGINGYRGTKRVNYTITGTPLSKATVDGIPASVTYTGDAIELSGYSIYIKETRKTPCIWLSEGVDYLVLSYENNVNAGKATITFKGINGYTGILKKTFKITPLNVVENMHRFYHGYGSGVCYSKGGTKTEIDVKFRNSNGTYIPLIENQDYTVKYSGNGTLNDGSNPKKMPKAKVTYKGNYAGTETLEFTIVQKDLDLFVTIEADDVIYPNRKNNVKPTLTLTDTGGLVNKKLKAGTDYDANIISKYWVDTTVTNNGVDIIRYAGTVVDANDIIPIGTTLVAEVHAKGNYVDPATGPVTATYRLVGSSVASSKISVSPQFYTGRSVEPTAEDLTVQIGKNPPLVPNVDYEVIGYEQNTNVGSATVTIHGIGEYGGTKTQKFTIMPRSLFWWWR